MERETGTLIEWNGDKKYGFIRPDNSSIDKLFIYTRALPHYQRNPQVGDLLTYVTGVDENNRYCATAAKIMGMAFSRFTVIWIGMVLLFGIYSALVLKQILPFYPLAIIYAGVSLVTILVYSRDKRAAELGLWRTRERTLHLLEIACGWPGALLAQLCYRHKIKKLSYQIVFWVIVAGHGALWYYLLNHKDTHFLYHQTFTNDVKVMVNNVKEKMEMLLASYNNRGSASTERPNTALRVEPTTNAEIPSSSKPRPSKKRIDPTKVRIVSGIVKEVRSKEGIVVDLQTVAGMEGIIDKSLLVENFVTRFSPGDHIQVGISKITMRGDKRHVELMLIEKQQ